MITDHLYFIFHESFVHILYPFSIRLFIFFLLTCKNSLFLILILCLLNRLSIFLTCLSFFGNFCGITELWLIVWSTLLNFASMAFGFCALSKKLPVPQVNNAVSYTFSNSCFVFCFQDFNPLEHFPYGQCEVRI